MTQFTGPRGGDLRDDDPFALWDAAYVLGSLSSNERREYESHLSGCAQCQIAVSELSGMPALLALLDREEMQGLDDNQPEQPPLRPELLEPLLAKVSWRRRRSRLWTSVAMAAAAAVLAIGLVLVLWPGILGQQTGSTQAAGPVLEMTRVAPSPLNASVTLTSYAWGTRIDMACTYGDWSGRDPNAPPDELAMVVLGRDGSATELTTWLGLPGATALPSGNTALPIDEIVAVQLVSSGTRDVLLQKDV